MGNRPVDENELAFLKSLVKKIYYEFVVNVLLTDSFLKLLVLKGVLLTSVDRGSLLVIHSLGYKTR